MSKQRLDMLLVERSLCTSRNQAQRLIRAGEVRVNQQILDKPGIEVNCNATIELQQKPPFVSRGGEKLAKALQEFTIEVDDRICLDGGISTGGFTDCLLQAGAKRVYGIDVGYGQVAWGLRNDPRVILRERTNLRHLQPNDLYGAPVQYKDVPPPQAGEHPPVLDCPENGYKQANNQWADLAVVDVSFISLKKILPALNRLLDFPQEAVLLVKPQFEVGREKVGKKGVVRNSADQARAIWDVLEAARELDWFDRGLTWSPLTGPAGNLEYLLWLSKHGQPLQLTLSDLAELAQKAQLSLK